MKNLTINQSTRAKVRVWKLQDDVRMAIDTKTYMEEEAVVEGLQQNTVYTLRVLGWSASGDGAISEARYFMLTSKFLVLTNKSFI